MSAPASFATSRSNLGAICETIYGTRVEVVGHALGKDCAQHDEYDLLDLDTGELTQRMGFDWYVREIPRPIATMYRVETWNGDGWSRWARIEGIAQAIQYARFLTSSDRPHPWRAARVVCGEVVIEETRAARVKAA